MKKTRFVSLIMILAVMLFGGITLVNAKQSIPDAVVSDKLREVEYLENFPVIMKTANNGAYYIYCLNMSVTYASDIKFTKTDKVDDGFVYILNNKPNTGDKDKDFYITQMAVWYYEDYLNQNNFNLVSEVKKYIIRHKDTNDVCRQILALLNGAKNYKAPIGEIKLPDVTINFTEVDGYYVSDEIPVKTTNIVGNLNYSLKNAPIGSKIVKSANGVKVKVPVNQVPEGRQITITLDVKGNYNKDTGYYYFFNSNYQKVLFQDALTTSVQTNDTVKMIVSKKKETYEVKINKTDVTQTKEVEGATLVLKNEAGDIVDTWVSTKESHNLMLKPGKYSLTETIAPKGYKLTKTTIEFLLDNNGGIFVKNEKGVYESVNRVVMINELVDVVSFAKKDSESNKYVSGATLVIKDQKGKVVKEFVTSGNVFQMELDPGYYTLSEKSAPKGYVLSKEVIYFYLMEDGTLKVKNNKGEYADSAIITFYNKKEVKETIVVPATDLSSTLLIVGGIALLIGGAYFVKKTIKEC